MRNNTVLGLAAMGGVVVLLAVAALTIDFEPNLGRLDVKVLSGSEQGQYYATVEHLRTRAEPRKGRIVNVSTQGSVDNLERLEKEKSSCGAHFGMVQDGSPWEGKDSLELIARLPTTETLFFIGKDADRIAKFSDLEGKKIGIGPEGSGTARLVHQILATPGFSKLQLSLSNHSTPEQLEMAANGELDLAAFVIAKDAGMIAAAVREKGLQIAGFEQAPGFAHQVPFLHSAVLPAGYYDPVAVLPPTDKHVLEVDTLILGNHCASKSASIALLKLLKNEYPDLIARNTNDRINLPIASVSKSFFEKGGPDVVDDYAPWLADLIPVSNLGLLLMGVSILFNVMGAGNRFRLWRIDAGRVSLENALPEIFGPEVTVAEIERHLEAREEDRTQEKISRLDGLIAEFAALLRTCRKHSLSMLVPMGQEMGYRYQETLIAERLAALRAFRSRLGRL